MKKEIKKLPDNQDKEVKSAEEMLIEEFKGVKLEYLFAKNEINRIVDVILRYANQFKQPISEKLDRDKFKEIVDLKEISEPKEQIEKLILSKVIQERTEQQIEAGIFEISEGKIIELINEINELKYNQQTEQLNKRIEELKERFSKCNRAYDMMCLTNEMISKREDKLKQANETLNRISAKNLSYIQKLESKIEKYESLNPNK
jgi:hypothetical protein